MVKIKPDQNTRHVVANVTIFAQQLTG